MKIEILAVGSELLSPFFIDTNSLYVTRRLNDLGLDVSRKTVVGDDWAGLIQCFKDALSRTDLFIVMGGLGPTEDDITRETCAKALGRSLVFDEAQLQAIEGRFRRRGKPMPASNRKQAFVVDGSEVLENRFGTAPGLWLVQGTTRIALLPGPPQELKPMFEQGIWPRLSSWRRGFTARRTLKITGLTESETENLITGLYPKRSDLRLTILASPGQIELHLTSFSEDNAASAESAVAELADKIRGRLEANIFSEGGEEIEEIVGRLLREQKKTLVTAESCTGGLLGSRLTNIPGSSDYFLEGFITYSNRAKLERLGVASDLIETQGAVSRDVCRAMALGALARTGADCALAITGIAGPAGGTSEKPVGLVYTALAFDGGAEVERNLFLGNREQVKFQSSQKALDMLRRRLAGGRFHKDEGEAP
jgi:nicotinamide-nucleotide amidase